METEALLLLIKSFKKARVLVVGDVILDLYVRGEVERISPEAPVPVVLEKSRRYLLGGAGNVAANAVALGATVGLLGVLGHDAEANMVAMLCREKGITARFVRESGRPTALKTRAVARGHQMLRLDREEVARISPRTEQGIVRAVKGLPAYDLVVVSDYAKGLLTPRIMHALRARFGEKKIVAGPKPVNMALFQNVHSVMMNLKEGEALTGIAAQNDKNAEEAVRRLARQFRASVVLTRGEHGMTVFDAKAKRAHHLHPRALKVFDVTGAGDTALSVYSVASACGGAMLHAAIIANHAAGVVVGKEGTEVVTVQELMKHLTENAFPI